MPRKIHYAQYRLLGDRLRRVRKRRGWTQAEVADRLNRAATKRTSESDARRAKLGLPPRDRKFRYDQAWISKAELGGRRLDAFEVEDFAELYGVPMERLLEEPQGEFEIAMYEEWEDKSHEIEDLEWEDD